jgi:hypothetical protein
VCQKALAEFLGVIKWQQMNATRTYNLSNRAALLIISWDGVDGSALYWLDGYGNSKTKLAGSSKYDAQIAISNSVVSITTSLGQYTFITIINCL